MPLKIWALPVPPFTAVSKSMVYNPFRFRILIRVLFLALTISCFILVLIYRQWYITAFCLSVVIIGQVYNLHFYVDKTNRELNRFISAIVHSDFTQRFSGEDKNASFRELNKSFNQVMMRFQQIKAEKEANYHYLQTLVENIGIGIITFNAKGEIQLFNKVSRQLLQVVHARNITALNWVSEELVQALMEMQHDENRLLTLKRDNEQLLLTLQATRLVMQHEEIKIVSLQNIRGEMEEQELDAWQKLIRVLTHEIMNSVTPIISLTSTISSLVDEKIAQEPAKTESQQEDWDDIRTGLSTIEKRSRGMLHFVESYRRLTRIPKPELQCITVAELFRNVYQLLRTDLNMKEVAFKLQEPDPELKISADPELIEQVLINLVKNAVESCQGTSGACVEIYAYADVKERERVRIEVKDNGPGIPAEIIDKIFVPFYTTKKNGSGIGLSLSRQIMRMHQGSLQVNSETGNTVFILTFNS